MLINNLFKHWTYQVFAPGTVLRKKYEAFKSLLDHDKKAHELMAELEEMYYNQDRIDFRVIENKYEAFSRCVAAIVRIFPGSAPPGIWILQIISENLTFM